MKLLTQHTHTPKTTLTEPENNKEHYNSDISNSILDSSSDSEWSVKGKQNYQS